MLDDKKCRNSTIYTLSTLFTYMRRKNCKERLTKPLFAICTFMRDSLLNVEYQSLKILTLRVIDADGVVGWLGELVQDAYAATRHGCCGEYGRTEIVLRHHLRAGKGEEYASGSYLLECLGIELAVAHKGVAQGILVLCEGRRVEDDEVVLVAHAVEVLEGILGKCFVARVAGEVELHIGAGDIDGT